MKWTSAILVVVTLISSTPNRAEDKVSYAGYSVVQVGVNSTDEMVGLEAESGCVTLHEWSKHGVGFLCDRFQSPRLRRAAKSKHISTRVSTRHLDRLIREEQRSPRSADPQNNNRRLNARNKNRGRSDMLSHNAYVGVDGIYRFLDALQDSYPNVNVKSIGKTFEGRDIKVVVVNEGRGLPKLFIDAGIHAREWISPAATLFFLDRLTKVLSRRKSKSTPPTIGEKYEWHIVPLANPDGYEFSRTSDRMWRKNRRRFSDSKCVGVDLNRNFPQGYGVGASKNHCSEVYQGPSPFSEAESRAIKNYVEQLQNIRVAVSVHSFGNVLIYPWGYTNKPHPNQRELHRIASSVANAIRNITGEVYQPGTAKQVFGNWGIAGGATDDYYITKGILYSFTMELPEQGADGTEHGFLLPPSNIKRVGRHLSAALTTLAIMANNN